MFNKLTMSARPTLIDINFNENLFYLVAITVNKCVEVIALLMIHMLEYVLQCKSI